MAIASMSSGFGFVTSGELMLFTASPEVKHDLVFISKDHPTLYDCGLM